MRNGPFISAGGIHATSKPDMRAGNGVHFKESGNVWNVGPAGGQTPATNFERSDGDRLSLAWPRGAASAHPCNLPDSAACPSGPLRAFLRDMFGPEPVERQTQDPWWKRGEECPF